MNADNMLEELELLSRRQQKLQPREPYNLRNRGPGVSYAENEDDADPEMDEEPTSPSVEAVVVAAADVHGPLLRTDSVVSTALDYISLTF